MQKIVYAKFNNNLMSAQKVRLVANLIRGKKALEAADILRFTNKYAAKDMLKVLNSAIANAVHNEQMDKKNLMVAQILVDNAQTFKRGKAVGRGRYHQILRRNCHITVGLTDGSEVMAAPAADKASKKVADKAESETKAAAKPAKKAVKSAKKVIKDSKSTK